MPLYTQALRTESQGFTNITGSVRRSLAESGVRYGVCVVFCPHTTAGITINENADPDVIRDMLLGLSTAYPEDKRFRHFEGNTTAHLKASAMGSGATVIVEDGQLVLGTWQGIYFCEFDGPRNRKFHIKIMEG